MLNLNLPCDSGIEFETGLNLDYDVKSENYVESNLGVDNFQWLDYSMS